MRTTYGSEKGEPFQVIAPSETLPLPVIDLSELPAAEREKEARRLVQEQASTPFDLARDPMTRNLLVKMGDEDHILVMLTHHIASDGWSTGILLRELTALYEAALLGKPAELPELPIQYADYAVWQRNWLQGEVLEQQLAYWKRQLEGAPPVLLLPTDRPRPEKPSFRGAMHRFLLPVEPGRCHSYAEPAAGWHCVHDHAGGVSDADPALQQADRTSCWAPTWPTAPRCRPRR